MRARVILSHKDPRLPRRLQECAAVGLFSLRPGSPAWVSLNFFKAQSAIWGTSLRRQSLLGRAQVTLEVQ